MRVVIPSYNRPACPSWRVFMGCDVTVVVHNDAQRAMYDAAGVVDMAKVVVSHVAPGQHGLARQRQWIMEHWAEEDEVFVSADDNIRSLTGLAPEWWEDVPPEREALVARQAEWRRRFAQTWSGPDWVATHGGAVAAEMAERGSYLAGMATVDNVVWRSKRFREVGYVIGKLMVLRETARVHYDDRISMEDFRQTAEHLKVFGRVTVYNHAFPVAPHYEAGGLGRKDERLAARQRDIVRLIEEYPGLFAVKPGPWPDLRLRLTTRRQVQQWQMMQTR